MSTAFAANGGRAFRQATTADFDDILRLNSDWVHFTSPLDESALDRLHAMITETLGDRDAFARWFGGYTSTPKYPEVDWGPEEAFSVEALRAMLADGAALVRNPASRFSFVRQGEAAVLLFVDGDCFACAGEVARFAEQLCAGDRVVVEPGLMGSDAAMTLIATLFNQGSVGFEGED